MHRRYVSMRHHAYHHATTEQQCYVTNLPTGVTGSWSGGVVTISGTHCSRGSIYHYTVNTLDSDQSLYAEMVIPPPQ